VTPVTTQNGISLIKLIPKSGPGDPATTALVHSIRDDRAAIEGQIGAHILVGGTTASNIDVSAKLSAALPIFLVVVVGLAFILLTFAFRTILVPIKSILGFLLSMAAALGAQVAMFQWGWGEHIFGITPRRRSVSCRSCWRSSSACPVTTRCSSYRGSRRSTPRTATPGARCNEAPGCQPAWSPRRR
jgi:uncharacterized membrane protein YdfJ with MMPL/SSD domain